MAKNYRSLSIGLGIIFILVILALIFYRAFTIKDDLIVGYMQISAHAPVIAAKDMKVYDEFGLNVKLENYPDTPSLMRAVENGHVDVGFQLTLDAVLRSAAKGKRYFVYYVARSTEKSPLDGLYSMQEVNKKFLLGKKIGHFPGPTGEAMTKRIVEKVYGLKDNEYKLVPSAPPLQILSLKSGEISLLFTYEPIGTMAVAAGAKRIISAPVEKYVLNGPWDGGIGVFTEDLVKRRKTTAIAFQNAIAKTCSLLATEKRGVAADAMSKLQAGLDVKLAMEVPFLETVFARNENEREELIRSLERQIEIYRELAILPSEGRSNLRIFMGENNEN